MSLKTLFSHIFVAIFYTGVIILMFTHIVAIGYGLYLWGAIGLPLSAACWSAFVVWLKLIAVGLISIIAGIVGMKATD